MKSLLEMFITECEYKNLSPLTTTTKTYRTDIGYLIDFLEGIVITDYEKLALPHLKRWVVEMQNVRDIQDCSERFPILRFHLTPLINGLGR